MQIRLRSPSVLYHLTACIALGGSALLLFSGMVTADEGAQASGFTASAAPSVMVPPAKGPTIITRIRSPGIGHCLS